ncbi:hypothetical protein [Chryseobacterium vrystaatense]|uniref:Uncharacterized protein n=1 Tax=Chryseobacterium vrystaatense TaxID=307480 RepID=A0A1M4ZHY6_9FLAO|nr:hypothetical protein [Chryseobacterium vrystaatense]SHF17611.1 hypothetical protein SAMN02787073_1602 [Chryseobacterium vrystaatense]
MTKEEQLKIYAVYLPYRLFLKDIDPMNPFSYELAGLVMDNFDEVLVHDNIDGSVISYGIQGLKPILYDLSYLTKEIEHEGERFVPVEYFEITDDHNSYPIEYDHGNIKLIKDLESIANHNSVFDIKFLPFDVVVKLIEWHFNIFNLNESEFINKATLKAK